MVSPFGDRELYPKIGFIMQPCESKSHLKLLPDSQSASAHKSFFYLRDPKAGGNTEGKFGNVRRMWRRLRNIFDSLRAYADLSPDLRTRQRVNQCLRDRPALSAEEWFKAFWQSQGISQSIAEFVYTHLPTYSGLDFARVRPRDRLTEDLCLPLVCWFDWNLSLCEDFLAQFGIDLSERFEPHQHMTIEDLMVFLNYQLLSVNRS